MAQDNTQPVGSVHCQLPAVGASNFVPLTPALLRRLADAHYLNVYEDDFQWRGDLWKKVHEDEDSFWRGEILKLPEDDWHERGGNQYSYFALLMEEPVLEDVFLYAIFRARKAKLQRLTQGSLHKPKPEIAGASKCAWQLCLWGDWVEVLAPERLRDMVHGDRARSCKQGPDRE